MQSRIRETGCYQRTWWARKVAFACFGIILASCSTVSKKTTNEQFEKIVKNLCLNSSGRGRIKVFNQTTLFSYESMNVISENSWKMAVDIPIHGEELLIINWKGADQNRTKLRGKFGTRIFSGARNHKNAKKYTPLLKTFIKGWSQLVFLNHQLISGENNKYCSGQNCKFGHSDWNWTIEGDHLYIDHQISKSSSLRFDFSDFKDHSPRRVSISPPGQHLENSPFQLDLFLKICQ